MKITDEELQVLEELRHYGTPLDATVLRVARAARRGLEITQSGNIAENALYAQASGAMGVMASIAIENVSDRVLSIKPVRLKMPWPDADFRWLRRLFPREVQKYGGYVLPASGPCGFDPDVVLNHRFTRDFKLYPRDRAEGSLFGVGGASVPDEYQELMSIPVQLIIYTGRDDSNSNCLKLVLRREEQRKSDESVNMWARSDGFEEMRAA